MEVMPYRDELDMQVVPALDERTVSTDWKSGLPLLTGSLVRLRDLRMSDARSLHALLTTEEVARFISPPPTTVEGFENFIAWTHRERQAGRYACFAVTLKDSDSAIGIFQVRQCTGDFDIAEWGFAIGSAFWGTGVFEDGAKQVLEFAFETIGVRRLEARATTRNGRGTGALKKIGAVQEASMRQSFTKNGRRFDQGLFAILRKDWRVTREVTMNRFAH